MKRMITVGVLFICFLISIAQVNNFNEENTIPANKENVKKIKFSTQSEEKIEKKDAYHKLKTLYKIDSSIQFFTYKEKEANSETGISHVKVKQYYKGYEIESSDLRFHYRGNDLVHVNGEYVKTLNLDFNLRIDKEKAIKIALDYFNSQEVLLKEKNIQPVQNSKISSGIDIVVCRGERTFEDKFYFAYRIELRNLPYSRKNIYIDIETGSIVKDVELIRSNFGYAETRYYGLKTIGTEYVNTITGYKLYDNDRNAEISTRNYYDREDFENGWRELFDLNNSWTSSEYDNAAKENSLLDAHWGAMKTLDYFSSVHGRDSYDDEGGDLYLYVVTDNNYKENNAYWIFEGIMIFGSGDGVNFDPHTSVDAVAHEFAHGICIEEANIAYRFEQGAINESLSDIWGACVKNYALAGSNIWNFGEDFDLRYGHSGIKRMSNPNLEEQPDTYMSPIYYWDFSLEDIHQNAGVMNYWFYLLSEGGSGTNDINNSYFVDGIGIEKAAKIVYLAETEYMTQGTDFADARHCTAMAALELYGLYSTEFDNVIDAWYAVGVALRALARSFWSSFKSCTG